MSFKDALKNAKKGKKAKGKDGKPNPFEAMKAKAKGKC